MFLLKTQPRVRLSMIMMTVKSVCMGVLATAISVSPSDYQLNIIKVATVIVHMLCSSAGQSVSQFQNQNQNSNLRNLCPPVCFPGRIVASRLPSSGRSDLISLFPGNLHPHQNILWPPRLQRSVLGLCCCLSNLKPLLLQIDAGNQREDFSGDQRNL